MNFKSITLLGVIALGGTPVFASTNIGIHIGIGMPAPIIVRTAPPRRAPDVVIASPGPGHIWIGGHHSWQNGTWVWVPGAWVQPPQAGTVWVEGRWDEGTKSWTPEHWEYAQTTPPPPVVVAPAPSAAPVIVQIPPPPPRVERRVHRPGPGFVWINGFWMYRGGQYTWVSGHWDRAPRGHRVWIEPRWERRGGNYVFIEGSWR